MSPRRLCPSCASGLALVLAVTTTFGAEALAAAKQVKATGKQQTVFKLDRFGRYAISATSDQGTAVQMVDRMAGPSGINGTAGEKNGRMDVFLEEGEVKVIAHSHLQGKGKAKLAVEPFRELHTGTPPRLEELRWVEGSLGDLEQRSYWLDITSRRTVDFEAFGRHLKSLRIWQEGTWLVDANPSCRERDIIAERPLTECTLHTTLEPGLYLLSAYGGEALPWADAKGAASTTPFYLRWSIPALGEAGRMRATVGPTGVMRWRVPGRATYFRVELAEKKPIELRVANVGDSNPYSSSGSQAAITKESRLPVAVVNNGSSSKKVITVTAVPGQSFILQHFRPIPARTDLWHDGTYFVTTLHGGDPVDSIDPTLVVYDERDGKIRRELSHLLTLDDDQGYKRRFNLLSTAQIFMELEGGASWEFRTKGTKARLRVEPILYSKPRGYRTPSYTTGTLKQKLDAGLYLLTIDPVEPGIVELEIEPHDWGRSALSLVGGGKIEQVTMTPNIQFPSFGLRGSNRLEMWVARQPDVTVGLFVRERPLDFGEAIPVTVAAGETVQLPGKVPEAGTLSAVSDSGTALALSLGGGETSGGLRLSSTRGELRIRNPHRKAVYATISLARDSRSPKRALPALSSSRLASLPKFDQLAARAPVFTAIAREERKTWLVKVGQDGFYHLQSTGRLRTTADLRSRVRIGFARGNQNGVGQNFLINNYLRSGTYQATIQTVGRSRGHMGVELVGRKPIIGGQLQLGIPSRRTVPASKAVAYEFTITEKAYYQLNSSGQHRDFNCRYEDVDGWPIMSPSVNCRQRVELDPGRYRVISLPEQTTTRRITELTRAPPPLSFSGHGPHALPLDQKVEHNWKEPQGDEARTPDRWRFNLPGSTVVTIALSAEVHGELRAVVGDKTSAEKIGRVFPLKGWSGDLKAGDYEVAITALRPNNNLPYTLKISPRHLVAGLTRQVRVPGSIDLSVGAGQLVELASTGRVDVRARLYDGDGALVATNDDRPDDWNFRITQRLSAGRYQLRLDKIGSSGTIAINMQTPVESSGEALRVGKPQSLTLGKTVRLAALDLKDAGPLLMVTSDAEENVGIALERNESGRWRTITHATGWHNRIALRRSEDPAETYRLRLWSLDQTNNPVKVHVTAPSPDDYSEGRFKSGIDKDDGDVALAPVQIDCSPGLFEVQQQPEGIMVCPRPGAACVPPLINTVSARADGIWWVMPAGTLRGTRVRLEPGSGSSVALTPGEIVAVDVAGDGHVAASAHSPAGQPGIAFAQPAALAVFGDEGEATWQPSHTAVSGSAAFAVQLSEATERLFVWNGSKDVIIAQVRAHGLAATAETASWPFGTSRGALAKGKTVQVALPTTSYALRLTLGAGMAAVLEPATEPGAGEKREVYWAGRAPESFEIDGDTVGVGGTVTVLNPTGDESIYLAELLALGDEPKPALTSAWQFERLASARGVVRLSVGAQPKGELEVLGNIQRATLVRWDGRIVSGQQIPVGPGGTLHLGVSPGPVMAWIDEPSGKPRGWGEPFDADLYMPVTVTAPMQLQLHALLHRQKLDFKGPTLVHLRAPSALVAKRALPGAKPTIEIIEAGEAIELWLPKGKGEVSLRGLAGIPMAGLLDIGTTTPVAIGEGIGPEVLLSPGGVSLFSFVVAGAAKDDEVDIGIGVRADADWVTAQLLTTDGEVLGGGLIQRASLSPGTYLVSLRLPPDVQPIRARPVLVGIEPPDKGPPEEVIRKYIEGNGGVR